MRVVDTEVLVSEVVGRGTVLAGRYRVLSPVVSDLEGPIGVGAQSLLVAPR